MQITIKKFYKISKNIFYFINKIGIKIFSQRAKKVLGKFPKQQKRCQDTTLANDRYKEIPIHSEQYLAQYFLFRFANKK